MLIHRVTLIPAFGHGAAQPRGNLYAGTCEKDIVDTYLKSLEDELDVENVRHWTMPTHVGTGMTLDERLDMIEANDLVVILGCGWDESEVATVSNRTTTSYAQKPSCKVAAELGTAIGQWGVCYRHGHKARTPVLRKNPLMAVPDTYGVMLEPFELDGPGMREYTRRLDELGIVIARTIGDIIRRQGLAVARGVLRIS